VGFSALVRSVWEAVRVRTYNEYTIHEYFRKQGATVGDGCRLLVRSLGSEPYLVTIGDQTLVSSDVVFVNHDGATWVVEDRNPRVNRFARIEIGSRVFVGTRSILMPGVRIGDRSVVAAGAVVTHDVPPGTIVAGVPARVIGTVDEFEKKVIAESIELPDAVYPLHLGDRELLRRELERALGGGRPA
jgi:acetyltransferase-like isoleucine patch superfamily enzyme